MSDLVRAMRCHRLDGPDSLQLDHVPRRAPGDGEVLVRLAAAGVNYPDVLLTQGKYQFKPAPPFAPGLEGAGTVLGCGPGVSGLAAGDRVAVTPSGTFGCFAEEVVVPAAQVHALPDGLALTDAAVFMVTYRTAMHALVQRGQLQAGETLLVHGAAGGVGMAGVQVGKALGAQVIGTAHGAAKVAALIEAGADHAIDTATGSVRDRVRELTGGRGADVVLDPVGGDVFDASLRAIAPGGRIVVAGFTAGRFNEVASNLVLIKEISVIGLRAGEWARRHPGAAAENLSRLYGFYAGGMRPRIAEAFPLERAAEALHGLARRRVVGKYVLTME